MKNSFFVGEGPEAKALIDEAFAKVQAFIEATQTFISDFPNNVGAVHSGNKGPVCGMARAYVSAGGVTSMAYVQAAS